MTSLNDTHDPKLTSWVTSANENGSDFAIQNLPLGVFRKAGSNEEYRGGVAIGNQILDVGKAFDAGYLKGDAAAACKEATLNRLMGLGREHWVSLRDQLSKLLRSGGNENEGRICLIPMALSLIHI